MASQLQSSPHSAATQVDVETPRTDGTVRSVVLMVAGQRIVIRSDQSEGYLHALADEINALIESLRQASPASGLPALMALASMQLLDRAICAEQALDQENLKVERHIARLGDILRNLDNAGMAS